MATPNETGERRNGAVPVVLAGNSVSQPDPGTEEEQNGAASGAESIVLTEQREEAPPQNMEIISNVESVEKESSEDIADGEEETASSLLTVSEVSSSSTGSETQSSLPCAQMQRRTVRSPLFEIERVVQCSDSSLVEGLERVWPSESPNEVSFLHFKLRSSSPK